MTDGSSSGSTQSTAAAPRLSDPLRAAFGLADDSGGWLRHLGEIERRPQLGRLGPFELLAEAGRGGQGVVYRARQDQPSREVALKRLAAGEFATPLMRARFEREIEAAAALDHPHIVTLYGRELIDDQLVLVMQWVEGVSFYDWARPPQGPPRSIRETLHAFIRVCDAIHHAHQRGVIHRDLKPSNILVDGAGQPHVLDFGLAKLCREGDLTLTESSNFLGTPAYAAPEQLSRQNDNVDVRTDVYALGAILYQALSGRRPFEDSKDLARLLDAVKNHEPPSLSSANRTIPRDLNAIVFKAISKEKERRYGSVQALADDVRRFLDGDAVEAHAPSAIYRFRKLFRRHAAVMSLAGLLLAAAMTFGVVSSVQAARERGLRKAADEAKGAAEREATIQRETADALIAIIEHVSSSASNRRTIEIKSLAKWLIEPIEKDTFKVRPDVRVKLHSTVCELYRWTHQLDAAIRHNALALETLKSVEPPDREQRHALMCRRSGLLKVAGRYVEAERAARDAMTEAVANYGRASEQVADTLFHLFHALRSQGKLEEAEAAISEAVSIHEQINVSPRAYADFKLRLFEMWLARKEFDKTLDALEKLLEKIRGDGHGHEVWGLWTIRDLGMVNFRLGHFEEAERYLRELSDVRVKKNGLKYSGTSFDLNIHAWTLHALGRFEEAIQRLEQALVFQENEAGNAVAVARMRFEMAVAMLADGRTDEGRRQLLRAISQGKITSPGDAEWDARAATIEAAVRENQLQYDESLAERLGDFSWLLSERSKYGRVSQETDPDAAAESRGDPMEP